MREIHLGAVLMQNRRRLGITQDKLAEFLGVSKGAVSKWETEATLPDITLLPRLAAFFNISIDELLGYEPMMTKEEIRKVHRKLSAEFYFRPFSEVVDHCREITEKYFSCFPLLFQIASLYVNHHALANTKEEGLHILENARTLFARVRTLTDDMNLAKQALGMEAYCLLLLNRPEEVLTLLPSLDLVLFPLEPILASAYQMTGRSKEAYTVLQSGIYQYLIILINLLVSYMEFHIKKEDVFEETYLRILAVAKGFHLDHLHPSLLITAHLAVAQGYMVQNHPSKALDALEACEKLSDSDDFYWKLHGDSYFDLLDEWLEKTLDLGTDFPRNEKLIRRNLVQAVSDNPLFAPLSGEPRYQRILTRLNQKQKGD